jgi:regulator of RNase E activity RraA
LTEKNQNFDKEYYRSGFLKHNTPTISDALDSLGISGGLVGIRQRSSQQDCVGFVYTVKFILMDQEDFKTADNYIENVRQGDIIVIDNAGRNFCTVWGNILTEVAVRKGIAGTIVYGAVRDISDIKKLEYPVFSSHVFMQSGKARVKIAAKQCPININGVTINSGDLLRCDTNGCVVVPQLHLAEVLKRSNNIYKTEQRILDGVRSGQPLNILRKKYSYAQPWKNQGEKERKD